SYDDDLSRFVLYFFFSSRRRHTISKRDWSSDVCSSDLIDMRRQLLPIVPLAIIAVVFFQVYSGWFGESADADIADGTYEIDYEMIEADNDNTSIADGYFTKPAKLIVENGTKYILLTVTGADMIKSLSAPSGPVEVISEDESEDTRTVKVRV